jgi:O-antigen/teichoic acid export membrane protein
MTVLVKQRLVSLRSDRMLTNSAMLFATTLLMGLAGALFWVVAARLQTPAVVGLAGSLVAASEAIALLAQLGLNIALMRTMPVSDRKAADMVTATALVATAGTLLALVYAVLLPVTSPRLHDVVDSPLVVLLFCLLVAATAVNVLTDNVFLAIDTVRSYLWLNGVFLGLAKCTLPFLLTGAGVLGLYGSVGGAAMLCGLASLWVVFRHLPGPRRLAPSRALREARGFAGAGYATYMLTLLPVLVLPMIVVNALGPAATAFFFLSAQIITVQNQALLAVGNSMYAESERHPERRRRILAHGARTMAAVGVLSAAVVVVAAPLVLSLFGPTYAEEGTATLRVMSLGVLGLGFNYWVAMRLRIAHHTVAMVVAQAVSTVLVLGLVVAVVSHGTVWAAAAWGIGQLVGGLVGLAISLTVAPVRDGVPAAADGDAVVEEAR